MNNGKDPSGLLESHRSDKRLLACPPRISVQYLPLLCKPSLDHRLFKRLEGCILSMRMWVCLLFQCVRTLAPYGYVHKESRSHLFQLRTRCYAVACILHVLLPSMSASCRRACATRASVVFTLCTQQKTSDHMSVHSVMFSSALFGVIQLCAAIGQSAFEYFFTFCDDITHL